MFWYVRRFVDLYHPLWIEYWNNVDWIFVPFYIGNGTIGYRGSDIESSPIALLIEGVDEKAINVIHQQKINCDIYTAYRTLSNMESSAMKVNTIPYHSSTHVAILRPTEVPTESTMMQANWSGQCIKNGNDEPHQLTNPLRDAKYSTDRPVVTSENDFTILPTNSGHLHWVLWIVEIFAC